MMKKYHSSKRPCWHRTLLSKEEERVLGQERCQASHQAKWYYLGGPRLTLIPHKDCKIVLTYQASPNPQLYRCLLEWRLAPVPKRRQHLQWSEPSLQWTQQLLRSVDQNDGVHNSVRQPLFGDSIPHLLSFNNKQKS